MEEHKLKRRKQRALEDGNLEILASTCRKLGEFYSNCGKYEEALKAYKEEETSWEAQGKLLQVAVANRMIGEVYNNMGNFQEALIHQEKHLIIARAQRSAVEEQRALATIGRTYFCLAESLDADEPGHRQALASAQRAYTSSLRICEQLTGISKQEQSEMKARLLLNIGLVLESQKDIQKAIEFIQKAVGLCRCHDLLEDLYRCYLALGMVYHRQGDTAKALTLLNKALEVAGRLDNKALLFTEALLSKAEVLFSLADFRGAKHALHKAYKLRTPNEAERDAVEKNLKIAVAMSQAEDQLAVVQDEDVSQRKKLYETLGDGCVAVKNYGKAIEFYLKMLECVQMQGEGPKSLAPAYVSLSQTYKDNRQYDKALEFFRRELELYDNNPVEACKTTLNVAEVLELQGADYAVVAGAYRSARDLAAAAGNGRLEVLALKSLLALQRAKRPELVGETELELRRKQQAAGDAGSSTEDDDVEEEMPDVGDDICLDMLSDESASEGEEFDRPQPARKRPRLKVRRNEKGETQLHTACISGRLVAVRTLLEQGHPVNVRDHCGWLPIHEACNHGHRDVVELLLDKGSAVNDRGGKGCGGVTPLHDAASCGHLATVELLLDRGASATARTDEGEMPLACLMGWYERAGKKMDDCEQLYFRTLEARLRKAMEKAGCHVDTSRPPSEGGQGARRENSSQQRQVSASSSRRGGLKPSRNPASDRTGLRRSVSSRESSSDSGDDCSHSVAEESDGGVPPSSPTLRRRLSPSASTSTAGCSQAKSTTSAAEEYVRTISDLRHRPAATTAELPELHTEPRDHVAFLAEREVGDDWLEDDVSRPKKKRKHVGELSCKLITSTNIRSAVSLDVTSDDFIEPSTAAESSSGRHVSQPSTSSLNLQRKGRAGQKSLLDAGFSVRQAAAGERSGAPEAPPPPPPVAAWGIKVRVEDMLFLVPVPSPEANTIGWLAEEVTQRCFDKKGLLPSLTLATRDGAILSEGDPVSLVMGEGELSSSVSSWAVPPIAEIYKKACRSSKTSEDEHLARALADSQVSRALRLPDLALRGGALGPVFQALRHQSTLARLHLGGNVLQDEGVKLLADCLQTLSQLEVLDISCNNVTSAGLAHLTKGSASSLASLRTLNLGFNPIGNSGVKHLCALTSSLASLKELVLTSCGFTLDGFKVKFLESEPPDLCVDGVEKLDISRNAVGREGVMSFLARLSPGALVSLNLAHSAAPPQDRSDDGSVAAELSLFFERSAPESLRSLDLAGCNLRDADVCELTRTLGAARHLSFLGLAHNPRLGSSSLRRLLQRDVAARVDLRGCPGVARRPREALPVFRAVDPATLRPARCRLETLALSLPGGDDEADAVRLLREAWQDAWGARASVSRGPAGLLVLSVSERGGA
ncbi:tonsoku-like protein [Bacillus rossius redtenbacheri]|uniref:tonsoku-like protein n=1 Tax=Bacillus rossius redtenbacheri TaxID=93214 RepID=UPI002FDCFC67